MICKEIFESKHKHDDWDDEVDDIPSDPDADKIPHLVMQFKKALDVDGNYPITFKDGTKVKLPLGDIRTFVERYLTLKPLDREKMQELAGESKENFDAILHFFHRPPAPRSVYDR